MTHPGAGPSPGGCDNDAMTYHAALMHQDIDFPRLAAWLVKSGRFTTASLGREIGLSQPAVSRLATGKTSDIGAAAALRLIRVAGGRVEVPEFDARPDEQGSQGAATAAAAEPQAEVRDAA